MVDLHEFLIPELTQLAEDEGFEAGAFTFTTSLASNVGDGFMGLLLRVIVSGPRQVDGRSVADGSLGVIVKMPPDSPERREQFKSVPIFEREALFYEKIFPLFVKFQHDRGITEECDGFFSVPRCYKIIADAEHQNYAMILEDLKVTGYRLFDKHKVIDFDHVTLLVQNLARMHALSFAIRDQEPDLFSEIHSLKDVMIEHMIDNTNQFEKMMQMGVDRAIKALDPTKDEEKIEKMTQLRDEIIQTLEFCASHEEAEPFGVLLHGDCWNNNMMYAYDENGSPQNIRLLDFQLCRYAAPVNDLLYFIFTSTNEELRAEHYDELLTIYHDTLVVFLTRLGSDAANMYTFDDFQDQLKKFGRFGLVMSIMLVQLIVAEASDLPDMDQVAKDMADNKDIDMLQGVNEKTDLVYNKRMRGVIDDIVRLGYF